MARKTTNNFNSLCKLRSFTTMLQKHWLKHGIYDI